MAARKWYAKMPLTLTRVKGDEKPEVAQNAEFPKLAEYPVSVLEELEAQGLVYSSEKGEDTPSTAV